VNSQVAIALNLHRKIDWDTKLIPNVANFNIVNNSLNTLHQIIRQRRLHTLFQPIVDVSDASILGHEGLIRGPAESNVHSPVALFDLARNHNLAFEIEHLSRQIVLESFAGQGNNSKLFINISPECLTHPNSGKGSTLAYIQKLGLNPSDVIIELTESSPTFDYELIKKAADHYRSMGFQIALDDLGEGFSSLRLWSELHPDYVKIDKHFVRDINRQPVKLEFVRSIQQIAESCGARVIAEGVETQAELLVLRDLRIPYVQGFYVGRPSSVPMQSIYDDAKKILEKNSITVSLSTNARFNKLHSISKLVTSVYPVAPEATNDEVFNRFENNPNLYSLPVVKDGVPIGLISRYKMNDMLARQYARELYGKKACMSFMDSEPLVVDKNMSLHSLSELITHMEPHHLSNGFIVTDAGNYLGISSGHALLKEITDLQISSARYANPLTLLPGNVPINEHMDRLLQGKVTSWACYCDLDNFKPYNDAYGFRRGDEVIQYACKLLKEAVDDELDFVGHIGGDDFIILFQSEDWEIRCQQMLEKLGNDMPQFYDEEDRNRGGIEAEDRLGNKIFYPFVSMSIGVVKIDSHLFANHHEISAAITNAKKCAKNISGNSLFIERRLKLA